MKVADLPESVRQHLPLPGSMLQHVIDGLQPDPIEWVWQWSERERRLSKEASAKPGAYDTGMTPFWREPMERLSPQDPTERVVVMKSAQIGASELANCFIAYVLAKGLGPTLLVTKTLDLAKDYSKQRLDPMIRDTPALRRILGERTGQNDRNQLLSKMAPNAPLFLRGAESAGGLRSLPIQNLVLDEVDSYPRDVEGEGDPCDLAIARTRTFPRRKIFEISTPTVEGRSRIAERYEQTDQRIYKVPCPDCGAFQRLTWKGITFDRDSEGALIHDSVHYACGACGSLIPHSKKRQMVADGRWEATAKAAQRFVHGYHISAIYSPWTSWIEIVEQHLAAGRNPQKRTTFSNTILGETAKSEGDAPNWMKLWRRREPYSPEELPEGVVVLTAGVDAQRNRIEVEIVGWGERLESWSIDWVVLDGDTAKAETWEQLDKLLAQTWPHANGGELGIARLAVDAGDGSYSAPTIHRWAREKLPRVMPVRGRGSATQLVYQRREATLRKGKSARGRMGTFWPVGVGLIKSELYAALRLEEPAAGDRVPSMWCHFPQKYDDEYFKQLTSERKTIRPNAKGIPTSNWRVLEGRRNEVLDCRVYARAAAYVLGVDTWSAEKWEHERAATRPAKEAQKPPTRRRVRRDSGFIEPRRQGWLDGK